VTDHPAQSRLSPDPAGAVAATPAPACLEVRDLEVRFRLAAGVTVQAVRGVSLAVAPGEIVGLVGESGCGKSTLARACVALAPISGGEVRVNGTPLRGLTPGELRRLRPDIQMVFQDPYASLNPRMTVQESLSEAIRVRRRLSGQALREAVLRLLAEVGLGPEQVLRYPHEFSGGQRQRVAIARALATEPRLVIADEPVSALDVSIQAQIINLLRRLCRERNLALLFISHDLAVVHYLVDRVVVMYLGRLLETGPAEAVISRPLHPYTRALVSAIPEPDPARERNRPRLLLSGELPSPIRPPAGCPFHTRCPWCIAVCTRTQPELVAVDSGRAAACLRLAELPPAGAPLRLR
jgi:oligopeptide/dipeptide ABC transporter ATP-binding protein